MQFNRSLPRAQAWPIIPHRWRRDDHWRRLGEVLVEGRIVAELLEQFRTTLRPIADLKLSGRAHRALVAEGINSIGDIIRMSPADLLALANVRHRTASEVTEALARFGLALRGEPLPELQPLGRGRKGGEHHTRAEHRNTP